MTKWRSDDKYLASHTDLSHLNLPRGHAEDPCDETRSFRLSIVHLQDHFGKGFMGRVTYNQLGYSTINTQNTVIFYGEGEVAYAEAVRVGKVILQQKQKELDEGLDEYRAAQKRID